MEAAEAANVTAVARMAAGSIAVAIEEFAGGAAVFAGVASPMTHALGIGMRGAVQAGEMERMERFFWDRGSACLMDLCPLADPSVIAFIESRPYRVVEFNNVLARRILPDEGFGPAVGVQGVAEPDVGMWARVVSEGFAEYMPVTEEMVRMMTTACQANQCWLAWDESAGLGAAKSVQVERAPVAGAAMNVQNRVALFSGDASLLSARRKGWQAALIRARLAAAQAQACEIAMATVLPGSASHRNYERAGFELVYMRVNLMREKPEQ